jgi:mRNA interferase RelE/StbE
MEQAPNIFEISNCKKLNGFTTYYRKRIGDYRIGFEKISDDRIVLIIVSHRSDIYSTFP